MSLQISEQEKVDHQAYIDAINEVNELYGMGLSSTNEGALLIYNEPIKHKIIYYTYKGVEYEEVL